MSATGSDGSSVRMTPFSRITMGESTPESMFLGGWALMVGAGIPDAADRLLHRPGPRPPRDRALCGGGRGRRPAFRLRAARHLRLRARLRIPRLGERGLEPVGEGANRGGGARPDADAPWRLGLHLGCGSALRPQRILALAPH